MAPLVLLAQLAQPVQSELQDLPVKMVQLDPWARPVRWDLLESLASTEAPVRQELKVLKAPTVKTESKVHLVSQALMVRQEKWDLKAQKVSLVT